MFKGLTQRAQRILSVLAQEEARQSHSDQLLPEHIILAILRDGEGLACKGLQSLNVNLTNIREEVERELPKKKAAFIFGDVPPSRRARQLMESAADEARVMGHNYIGTEHIILAAIQERDSALARIVTTLDLSFDLLRTTFLSLSSNEIERNTARSFVNQAVYHGLSGDSEQKAKKDSPGTEQAPSRTPLLDEYARDLTKLAKTAKLDPVVGREREIARVVRVLARRTKNNPVLVGEPGVGKTAIVEGLAQLLASEKAPESLRDKKVLTLDLAAVIAGTKYRGEFEDRLKKIMKEILTNGNIILFIDELHTIIGAGGAEGTVDAANMLKPPLARGELQCIGSTTLAEYRKHFEKDAALERRFQRILVGEPDVEQTLAILKGIRAAYETHHEVRYSEDALQMAARLAHRYISGRFMPDKAIDLIDEAGAKKKLESDTRPSVLQEIETEIARLNDEKVRLVASQNYEKAAEVRDRVRLTRKRLELLRQEWELGLDREMPLVDESDIREVISEITGIPLARLAETESKKLLSLEEDLHRAIIGQDEAVRLVAGAIRRSRAGISSPRRPQGSFIFLGPTGVGKTLLARKLAECLFGKEDALVRIDMSDYMEKHNASRLVGAPPGYVGYEEGGVLTEQIRRNPYRVILFDEIEKAHNDVFNLLLQVLEEGELKDNLGHTISFRNTVIIMTSNAGAREFDFDSKVGFRVGGGAPNPEEIRSASMNELKRLFRPEFINRIDDIVVFQALDREEILKILDLEVAELASRLLENGWSLHIQPKLREYLLEKGWDAKFGARPMRRAIQRELEDPLSRYMLEHDCPDGARFTAELRQGKVNIRCKTPPAPLIEPVSATEDGVLVADGKKV